MYTNQTPNVNTHPCRVCPQMLPYDELMVLLDLSSMRELEDFVIQDCIYPALLKCKLDQKERCLRVQDAFPRDVRPREMPAVTAALHTWWAP